MLRVNIFSGFVANKLSGLCLPEMSCRRGIPIAGIAGVLLAGKKHGFGYKVLPIVKELEKAGYDLPTELPREIGKLAERKRVIQNKKYQVQYL